VARECQVRFDGGHQQRYLADRRAVLRYVLAIAPQAASSRFEVYAEAEPLRLADGSPGGCSAWARRPNRSSATRAGS
jgi:hypothetical protein